MWFGLVNLVLVKLRRGVRGHPGVWLMRIRLASVAVCLARQVAPAWSAMGGANTCRFNTKRLPPIFSSIEALMVHHLHPDHHQHLYHLDDLFSHSHSSLSSTAPSN